ncbi:MAG: glycosyltransferase [Firmicutes bacterium]|nr:glycosyltransferase [Bacillota bacterium]
MVTLLRWTILIAALAPLVYYLLVLWAARRFERSLRAARPAAPFTPPISVLKPIRGLDRNAYKNFASFCQLDYPVYEVLFCASDPEDPAVPVVEQVMRDFPQVPIRLLIGAEPVGVNDRINKLCRLVREARYDLLVITDSDVRAEPGFLHAFAAAFRDARTGAAMMLFRSDVEDSLVSRLDGLGVGNDFWSSALVAVWLEGGPRFIHGAAMAARRDRLAEIGGFEAMAHHQLDDFLLGHRMARAGHRVALIPPAFWMVYASADWREYLRHELMRYVRFRHVRPLGYAGILFTYGLPWSLAAMAAAPSASVGLAYLIAYVLLRYASVWAVGVGVLDDPAVRRSWWLAPLRDAVAFPIWLAGFASRRFRWRGLEFRVEKGGRLVPVTAPTRAVDETASRR